ncbi:unnamed protein product [Musa banksii]
MISTFIKYAFACLVLPNHYVPKLTQLLSQVLLQKIWPSYSINLTLNELIHRCFISYITLVYDLLM